MGHTAFPLSPLLPTAHARTHTHYHRKRADDSQYIMDQIQSREWGILVMDEVHMMPSKVPHSLPTAPIARLTLLSLSQHGTLIRLQSFQKAVTTTKAHCKLGLTATVLGHGHARVSLHSVVVGEALTLLCVVVPHSWCERMT